MDDLISRGAVKELLNNNGLPHHINPVLWEELNDLPSAQPEIIRCKDCKYWDTTWQNDYAPNYHYCPMIDGAHRNDFYCAYAERRTDG